jgi:hypothetical protein
MVPNASRATERLARAKLKRLAERRKIGCRLNTGGRIMASFILVSQEKENFYVNVDQVRILLPQSKGGGTTIVFDQDHSVTVDDEADHIMRFAK